MKYSLSFFIFILVSCNAPDSGNTITDSLHTTTTVPSSNDSLTIVPLPAPDTNNSIKNGSKEPAKTSSDQVFGNKRFKDVKVEKTGNNKYKISGKAQIFEASFSWVIEDGHNELKKGHEMTDAGAPEWGNFVFTVDAPKKTPHSTLHLILFESSAKDGSRQYQLPIPLL